MEIFEDVINKEKEAYAQNIIKENEEIIKFIEKLKNKMQNLQ